MSPRLVRAAPLARASRPLSVALAALALTACSYDGITSPSVPVPIAGFSYQQIQNSTIPYDNPGEASVVVGDGGLTVRGIITTPSACSELEAEVTRGDGRIEVTVTSRNLPVLCLGVTGTFSYELRLAAVPGGRYTLDVLHVRGNIDEEPGVRVHRESVLVR